MIKQIYFVYPREVTIVMLEVTCPVSVLLHTNAIAGRKMCDAMCQLAGQYFLLLLAGHRVLL